MNTIIFHMKIFNAFAAELTRLGLSTADAARLSGISYWTIYQHVRGWRGVSAEAALRYERRLGIPRAVLRPDLWPPGGLSPKGLSPGGLSPEAPQSRNPHTPEDACSENHIPENSRPENSRPENSRPRPHTPGTHSPAPAVPGTGIRTAAIRSTGLPEAAASGTPEAPSARRPGITR